MISIKSQRGHALSHSHNRFEIFDKNAASVLVVALVAGIASYLNKTNPNKPEGPKFSWYEFLAHTSACIVAAFIASSLCNYYKVDDNIRVAIVGLAGWGGPAIMEWMNYVGRAKIMQLLNLEGHAKQDPHRYEAPGAPTAPTNPPIQPMAVQTPAPQPGAAPGAITASTPEPVRTVEATPSHIAVEDSSREARLRRKAEAQANRNTPP